MLRWVGLIILTAFCFQGPMAQAAHKPTGYEHRLSLLLGLNRDSENSILYQRGVRYNLLDTQWDYVHGWITKWQIQPQSICQRPALYEYLRLSKFIVGVPVKERCPEFTVLDTDHTALVLNVNQIKEFRYLVSGTGDSAASRFGHSMLQMVVCHKSDCKPEDTDIINVGFTAMTDSGQFSLVGGVKGSYPSFLNFTNDMETRQQLLYEDLRDMTSTPLILSTEEKDLLFYILIERYWTYAGYYKFIHNNCSSEMLKLIQIIFPNQKNIQDETEEYLKPMRLFEILSEARVLDLKHQKAYSSEKSHIDQYLWDFLPSVPNIPLDLPLYCSLKPQIRQRYINSKMDWSSVMLARWDILESACYRIQNKELKKIETNLFWDPKSSISCSEDKEALKEKYRESHRRLFAPELKTTPADVVPNASEIIEPKEVFERRKQMIKTDERIRYCAKDAPKVVAARSKLLETRANLKLVRK